MTRTRILLYAVGFVTMLLISLILSEGLWLVGGWLAGVTFALYVDTLPTKVVEIPEKKMHVIDTEEVKWNRGR